MTEDSETARRLRPKERRVYTDEDVDDDEIDGRRKFSLDDKLTSVRYNSHFAKELRGDELTLKYFQEHGFTTPILVKDKTGLGMRVPSQNFKVSDVKQCVGSRRQLDVMDVTTQKGLEMSMKEWVRYYENEDRDRLLNVISLEFSHTRLENYVEQPLVVRQLDWVDGAWPRYLKESQTECTNIIERMKYPKVQKYCLMSVKGCYTDFHIDMGGTSVWYHVLHGGKIFWLIPPTEKNLQLYEEWVLSGKQGDMFFGDKVEKCQRLALQSGYTFFIPTGWIHAVYTPEDSLVFGGNWLHSFNIPMQLRISEVEDRTRVPQKFRYPFFQELHWYLLERYSTSVMGRSHRVKSEEEMEEDQQNREQKVRAPSPGNSGDEKGDGKLAELATGHGQAANKMVTDAKEDSGLAPRSPAVEDPQRGSSSPRSFRPKSPQSPSRPMSPRQVSNMAKKANEENTAPRSPKVGRSETRSPRPSDLEGASRASRHTRSDSSSSNKDSKKSDQSPSKKNEQSELKKNKSDSNIKTYFNQSELIKPVSVKLENCMLAGEKSKTLLDGGAPSSGTAASGALGMGPVVKKAWIHLTQWELKGLRSLVKWLEELPPNKRSLPRDIPDSDSLLRDVKKMLLDHAADDPRLAVSGEAVLRWPPRKLKRARPLPYTAKGPKVGTKKPGLVKRDKDASSVRRRRVRCKVCEPCTRDDCRECHFCMDMKKYGGAGRMKQSCKSRQCMMPVLPTSAVCAICCKDERIKTEGSCEPYTTLMECGICWEIVHPACVPGVSPGQRRDGTVNEDLPNSWECPKCCGDGKQGQSKPRVIKGLGLKSRVESRQSSSSSDGSSSRTEIEDDISPSREEFHHQHRRPGRPRIERDEHNQRTPARRGRRPRERNSSEESVSFKKRLRAEEESPRIVGRGRPGRPPLSASKAGASLGRKTSRGRERVRRSPKPGPSFNTDTSEYSDDDLRSHSSSKESSPMRSRVRLCGPEDDTSSLDGSVSLSGRKRKDPNIIKPGGPVKQVKTVLQRYVVRPAPIPPPPKYVKTTSGYDHALDQEIWSRVFQCLGPNDLCVCMRVCRTWNRWCIDRRLWSKIIMSRRKITRDVLVGIVRRQPVYLDVSWTNLNRKQLEWLAARLPQLKHLSLAGNSWAAVCALCCSSCPLLYSLDLKWVSGIRDSCIFDLISPPTDHRPGVDDTVSRLHRIAKLELAGSDVTNKSLDAILASMPKLAHLDISFCTKVTDQGVAILSSESAPTRKNLTYLDLTGCNQLTDDCFAHLQAFTHLQQIIIESCPKITMEAFHNFARRNSKVSVLI